MPAVANSLASANSAPLPTPHLPSASLLPPEIFHNLGQYSPWFPADDASQQDVTPDQCTVTFVSQLERHGSRYPTNGAYKELRKTLRQIAKHLEHVPDEGKHDKAHDGLEPELKWLRHWVEAKKSEDGGMRNRLGNSELTPYGQYEAYSSGWRFYEKYSHLFDAEEVDVNSDYSAKSVDEDAHLDSWFTSICSAQPAATASSSTSPAMQLFSRFRQGVCNYLAPQSKDNDRKLEKRPFVRASGADRVITTSRFWLQGFAHSPDRPFRHASPESAPWPQKGRTAVLEDFKGGKPHRRIRYLPKPDVIISEARKADKLGQVASNNTLDVYTCTAFERDVRDNSQSPGAIKTATFAETATAAVRERLARQLGVRKGGSKDRRGQRLHLEPRQVLQLFSLCAFDTVARIDPYGLLYGKPDRNDDAVSPFCSLFQPGEYAEIYEVATNMEKDYGFAAHQPLSKALATPWLRELLGRLEARNPVMTPPTSINTTLDRGAETFPLPSPHGPRAFVDFTHDNQLAPVIAASGLWDEEHAWETSLTTPFNGRLSVEKLSCDQGEYIRILVNDQPASVTSGSWCPDALGSGQSDLCPLDTFLGTLAWVDQPNEWNKCYSKSNHDHKEDGTLHRILTVA